ncbi:MAG: ABC transporter permease [Acidobacteria bacterium]|nr:ABC transporter permease [Acidobacteriota bacterium]
MRLAWSFFKRDAAIALSYRISFTVQFLTALLILGLFYYLGRTVNTEDMPALKPYGGSLMAFLLVGFGMLDWMHVSLHSFATQIREAQMTGTLEATLMSPVRLPVILIYSSLWNYFFSTLKLVLYLVLGAVLYGVSLGNANLLSAVVVFLLTAVNFAGLGIWWASTILLVKRGESIMSILTLMVVLASGAAFPTSVLPAWVQQAAQLIPLTHALDGMRFAILQGYSIRELSWVIVWLAVFGTILLTSALMAFHAAVKLAKRTGSLTEY